MEQFKNIMRELTKVEISSAKLETISSKLTDIDSTLKDVSDKTDKYHAIAVEAEATAKSVLTKEGELYTSLEHTQVLISDSSDSNKTVDKRLSDLESARIDSRTETKNTPNWNLAAAGTTLI